MGLQTDRLVLFGLGLEAETRGDGLRLRPGIHLRWAFTPEAGFPPYGFTLLRRSSGGEFSDALHLGSGHHSGETAASPYPLPPGILISDQDLSFTTRFTSGTAVELDLRNRAYIRYQLPTGDPACLMEVHLAFDRPNSGDTVSLTVYDGNVIVETRTITADPVNQVLPPVRVELDRITAVTISGGEAGLLGIRYMTVASGAQYGWTLAPVSMPNAAMAQPISLPVANAEYPCRTAPATTQDAMDLARARIDGTATLPYSNLTDDDLAAMIDSLAMLVATEPADIPMHERTEEWPAHASGEGPTVEAPRVRSLDLLLLMALNPAFAAMLGLYALDRSNDNEVPWDYLVIADHDGVLPTNPDDVPDWIRTHGFARVDAWIAFRLSRQTTYDVEVPDGFRAYAVPAAPLMEGDDRVQVSSSAGLKWQRPKAITHSGRGRGVRYRLFRAFLGNVKPEDGPADGDYRPMHGGQAIVPAVAVQEQRAPIGWPPFPLDILDIVKRDGWYAYRLRGLDIFGRIGDASDAAEWRGWDPESTSHPFAIALLDLIAPPPPIDIWASIVDPQDPLLVKDEAWTQWQERLRNDGVGEEELAKRVGLRVRWKWTTALEHQAPDLREFRVYFHLGTELPTNHDDAFSWHDRILALPSTGPGLYEYFLDPPQNFVPDLGHPLLYGWVGVTAADDKPYVADRRHDPLRYGNESVVGVAVKVARVKRVRPPAPLAVPDGERVYASPADYHGHAYYSYRWPRAAYLKAHIFRALDESVFAIDWKKRPRNPLALNAPPFDDTSQWNEEKKLRILAELAPLDILDHDEDGMEKAFVLYRRLSDDALHVLASQPEVTSAFTRLTLDPVGGDAQMNRRGPDTPEWFPINPDLDVYIDRLDGRATNRYFYRCAYVDGAHNQGALSVSSAPVYLTDVIPPLAPSVTRAVGGERSVTLIWSSNREADLAEYRVYRAETSERARDLRLMQRMASIAAVSDPAARAAEIEWTDVTAAAREYWFCVTAVDRTGNESVNVPVVSARAYREVAPPPPEWRAADRKPDGIELTWLTEEPLEILVQRRDEGSLGWRSVALWLPLGSTRYRDKTAGSEALRYRLVARDEAARLSTPSAIVSVPEAV